MNNAFHAFANVGKKRYRSQSIRWGYIPSLERQIIFACFAFAKKFHFSVHLLNRVFKMLKYSSGSFFRRNADVSTLSVDFFGESFPFFHYLVNRDSLERYIRHTWDVFIYRECCLVDGIVWIRFWFGKIFLIMICKVLRYFLGIGYQFWVDRQSFKRRGVCFEYWACELPDILVCRYPFYFSLVFVFDRFGPLF